MRESLVVDKAVCSGRLDGLFVKLFSIQTAVFNTCDLCADKRRTVFEILRTIHRPDLKLSMVSGQSFQMLLPPVGKRGVVNCGVGKRCVEVMLCRFQSRLPCPGQIS